MDRFSHFLASHVDGVLLVDAGAIVVHILRVVYTLLQWFTLSLNRERF